MTDPSALNDVWQIDFSTLSAIIAVKTLGKAFEAVREKGVPIIWVRAPTFRACGVTRLANVNYRQYSLAARLLASSSMHKEISFMFAMFRRLRLVYTVFLRSGTTRSITSVP